MNGNFDKIRESIDRIFVPGSYFYNEYIVTQLKKRISLDLIQDILNQSQKTPAEAIIILLAAIRYLYKDIYILKKMEQEDSFQKGLNEHYNELLRISIEGKVQGNAPERAFPILEILHKKLSNEKICVIELGASYGLIGNCLLNPEELINPEKQYFKSDHKIPEFVKKIEYYLGIDINPPEKEWLLACFSDIHDAQRIENYINSISSFQNFQLIKASALGFSNLDEVKKILHQDFKIIILTSFMLYQLNSDLKEQLISEIKEFCKQNNSNWICQEVEILGEYLKPNYFIELDGDRIINLEDDKCTHWQWLN